MASALPLAEMQEVITCPICLDYLTDPMVLECGHSFCQGCITNYYETWQGLEEEPECPICKFKFQKGDFRRNWQLANLIEKIKLMPVGKQHLCLQHKEKFHLFCQEDEKLVCVLCERSPEHQGHTMLLLEEAVLQYKDKVFKCLEFLKTEREKILGYIANAEDKSQEMLKRIESGKQKRVTEFRTLHQLLNEVEKDLLADIEEVEKEVARERDNHLARLSEELSSLESLIQEMEEKHQQPESELLQDVRETLERFEKKKVFENPEVFPSELIWKAWDCPDIPFLACAMKPFTDTLAWASPKLRVNVTLDPDSVSSRHVQTRYQKQVRWRCIPEELSGDPEKHYGFVLGREGFTGGCHFWEVVVGGGEGWAVGVARRPMKGKVNFTPEEGIWAVGRWKGHYKAFLKDIDPPLTPRGEPSLLRVCLNYNGGRVAFFSAGQATLLYEFFVTSFCGETVHPFFAVYGDGDLCLSF
ncbi:tripartite motif-containing protein 10-like isoform X2 [Paroedura picta]